MSTATALKQPPNHRPDISPQEWEARLDLAAAYRLGARFGWTDLLGTHFSLRVPGTTDQYLVNPYGLFFEEITASSLVKIDLKGNLLSASEHGVNPAADRIHGAIYAARPEIASVIHLHSVDGTAISIQKDGLLPLSQNALILLGRVGYYTYGGLDLDDAECAKLTDALGDGRILIMRNHGTLTTGRTIGEAFSWMFRLEKAAKIQIAALAGERELTPVAPEVVEHTIARGARSYTDQHWSPGARIEWAAFRRKIDREDPGYAQ